MLVRNKEIRRLNERGTHYNNTEVNEYNAVPFGTKSSAPSQLPHLGIEPRHLGLKHPSDFPCGLHTSTMPASSDIHTIINPESGTVCDKKSRSCSGGGVTDNLNYHEPLETNINMWLLGAYRCRWTFWPRPHCYRLQRRGKEATLPYTASPTPATRIVMPSTAP